MSTENGVIVHGIRCYIAQETVLYCTENGVILHRKRCDIARNTV